MFGMFSAADRSNELQQCLDLKWRMKSGYASAFLNEYRSALAKQYDKAYKQARPALLNAAGDELQLAYFEIADWALVGQAYRAYMSDLRSGKNVGTNVEKVIWAILLMRIDLIKTLDSAFANYLVQEQERQFPNIFEEVFETDL